ncbi:hypothetical protein MYSE111917_16595 [Mycobacterium senriense]
MTAWIAFAISVGTFVWKFVETYIRWPRLGVDLRQSVTVTVAFTLATTTTMGGPPPQKTPTQPSEPGPPNQDRFDIIVVNSGAEATTVFNVGIRSADGSQRIDVLWEREHGREISGPELPARVEAHGTLTWTIDHELTSRYPRGTKLVGWAHRWRQYHKYPKSRRNTISEYVTPLEYVKN